MPQMRASRDQVTVGVSRKWVIPLELLKVITDVERLFAPHRWASCIGRHDSQN